MQRSHQLPMRQYSSDRPWTHYRALDKNETTENCAMDESNDVKSTTLPLWTKLRYGPIAGCIAAAILGSSKTIYLSVAWSVAQWTPSALYNTTTVNEIAWQFWEQHAGPIEDLQQDKEIPVVYVQEHLNDLVLYLETNYGKDWRKRPLLLKGLWSHEALRGDATRRLSLNGLLKENISIPYFSDARLKGALSPDSFAPLKDIVANISRGEPHKIGTQLFVKTWPDLINEVAPIDIITDLFGNYFSSEAISGSGPMQLFPALTTVPMFVASGKNTAVSSATAGSASVTPYTALHCEPIGNVAVQLSGKKRWTLVQPEFSRLLKPSVSPDGRAFFASWSSDNSTLAPVYSAITDAGDAMWVPTWVWHRVDYIESEDIAIGASLFHFRPIDFVANNPLYALLILPAILSELFGYNTQ